MDYTGAVLGILQTVSGRGTVCNKDTGIDKDALEEFNTDVFVKQSELGQVWVYSIFAIRSSPMIEFNFINVSKKKKFSFKVRTRPVLFRKLNVNVKHVIEVKSKILAVSSPNTGCILCPSLFWYLFRESQVQKQAVLEVLPDKNDDSYIRRKWMSKKPSGFAIYHHHSVHCVI